MYVYYSIADGGSTVTWPDVIGDRPPKKSIFFSTPYTEIFVFILIVVFPKVML